MGPPFLQCHIFRTLLLEEQSPVQEETHISGSDHSMIFAAQRWQFGLQSRRLEWYHVQPCCCHLWMSFNPSSCKTCMLLEGKCLTSSGLSLHTIFSILLQC